MDFIFDQNSTSNEIFMKCPVIIINHHKEDGYYDSLVGVEPKPNFSRFLTSKITVLVKIYCAD